MPDTAPAASPEGEGSWWSDAYASVAGAIDPYVYDPYEAYEDASGFAGDVQDAAQRGLDNVSAAIQAPITTAKELAEDIGDAAEAAGGTVGKIAAGAAATGLAWLGLKYFRIIK